jgi:predicted metalloprotease with PDZ domain
MKTFTLLFALLGHPHPALKPAVQYTLRVDSADLSGWSVEIRLRTASETFRLAMAAHPEYDDRYWRYVRDLTVEPSTATVTKVDSAVWEVAAPRGEVTVRYRIALPPSPTPRAAWRPFLTPTGGLIGGPHAFMYLLDGERMPVIVTLVLPASWEIATGMTAAYPLSQGRGGQGVRTFVAPNAATLIDSPILVGRLRHWRFTESGVPHRVVYWPLPDAAPFDTAAFVSSVQQTVRQAIALFGRTPYREYTFLFQDGAYGALEHGNSVTLGAPSKDLASDPHAALPETAHEFFHTWNLMAMRPVEYRDIDYRTQAPVSSLWFSEGLTMFYADLLLRRAGFQLHDSTRVAHLERLISSYVNNPAYARFSAEQVSRVAYNAEPGALGDYSASTHLQGELIGTVLDLIIRDATHGRRTMDEVMRLLFDRSSPPDPLSLRERGNVGPGIDGLSIERAVETACACDVRPFFDAYVRNAGLIDFDRYLDLIGLKTSVARGPAVNNGEPERDLRIYGWVAEGDSGVQLIVTNPASTWGSAGLHSRDRLVAMNGAPLRSWSELRTKLLSLRIGDTARVDVARPSGPFATTVTVTGFERATVRIETAANASDEQRRLAAAWMNGTP